MKHRRLCLRCLAAWMDINEELCATCTLDYKDFLARSHIKYTAINNEPVDWYGPTLADVDSDDLAFGFHVEDVYGFDGFDKDTEA